MVKTIENNVRQALTSDIDRIMEIRHTAIKKMHADKIYQWDDKYPLETHFLDDIKQGTLLAYEDSIIQGFLAFDTNEPPTYKLLKWNSDNSMYIHRVIIDPESQGRGISHSLFSYCKKYCQNNSIDSLKIDTHPDNLRMQAFLKKQGFEYRGYDEQINRLCYEFNLS